MTRPDVVWWTDDVRPGTDALGRRPFADRVADLIRQLAGHSSSTVLGLVGAWGSGKSTTIEYVLDALDGSGVRVSRCNPWALSGGDAVAADLIASIGAALPDAKGTKAARKLLGEYRGYVAPLVSLIPIVGGPVSELARAHASRTGGPTVHAEMTKVTAALEHLKQPVLVVVDDVDRLQPDELLALFKAVRLLGRLPYVHYLLAYDEQTVLDVVSRTAVGANDLTRALAFLEKIVTLRLTQPPTRPEQAAKLFGDGLSAALGESRVVLSEEQQRRLADEQAALFAHTLREPRAIHRFAAQLRTYLPLVGPEEIDVVDFAVLTFLRVAHPKLYAQLQTDQRLLTSGALDLESDEHFETWVDGSILDRVDVVAADRARIAAAVGRLFPRIDPEQGHAVIAFAQLRRQQRRVSSPDHVARYFALVPPEEDVPDSELLAALQAWSAGRPQDAPVSVTTALRPDPSHSQACELAARVLRRAETYSGLFDPTGAGALLTVVLGLLPLPGHQAGGESPEAAWIEWAARLFEQADGPPPEVLLAALERPADAPTPLLPMLRALSIVMDERRLNSRLRPGSRPWLDSVLDAAASSAWKRLVLNVRLSDAAPDEPVSGLLAWLDMYWGEPEVNRRLGLAFDKGMTIADFVARLVTIGVDTGTGSRTIIGFDPTAAIRRVGSERLSADAQFVVGPSDLGRDESDVTWANRRAIATDTMRAALADGSPLRSPVTPVTFRADAGPLLNYRPSPLQSEEAPELSIRLSVLAPSGAMPQLGSVADGRGAEQREDEVLRLFGDGPLSAWLRQIAPRWHARVIAFDYADTEARTRTVVRAGLEVTDSAATSFRQRQPVVVGAQMLTGRAPGQGEEPGPAALVLTVQVGVWLVELDDQRRPSASRSNVAPVPAALSLPELHELLVAVCSCIRTAQAAGSRLFEGAPLVSDLLVDLSVECPAGLASLVNLQTLTRRPTSSGAHVQQTCDVTIESLTGGRIGLTPQPEQIAMSLLSQWLENSGFRGFDDVLAGLVGPPQL